MAEVDLVQVTSSSAAIAYLGCFLSTPSTPLKTPSWDDNVASWSFDSFWGLALYGTLMIMIISSPIRRSWLLCGDFMSFSADF